MASTPPPHWRRFAAGLVLALVALGVLSQEVLAQGEKRVALVVGNSAYRHTAALTNPLNDARDVAAALERTGFQVIVAVDADKRQMDGALRAFAEKLSAADVALFYYAGHGLQVGAENFLVPVDAQLANQRDLEFEAVRLNFVLRQMEIDREGKTTIVMLDACRDNPLSRSLARTMGTRSTAVGQGLAPASTGVGTFIAYATQPGNVALDGDGRNSPFTAALLKNMAVQGRNLNATMIEVRKSVIQATGGRQVPWDHSALTGDFYFVPGERVTGSQVRAPEGRTDDVEALKSRLKALEEAEQKRLASATPPGRTGAALAPPEALVRHAETRARLAVAEDQAKDLQRRLLEARRIEGQARDPAERQRLMQDSMRIQMEMTRAGQLAKRLREEAAALSAPTSPSSPQPPATANTGLAIDLAPSRTERGYDLYEGGVIAGEKIKVAGADSLAGCLNTCRNTAGCVAGEYQPRLVAQRACSVYGHVRRLAGGGDGSTAFVMTGLGAVNRRPQLDCEPMSIQISTPIPLSAGMKLCNGIGQHETTVERIGERGVAFAVVGGRNFTCAPGALCQFDWPGAPSPVFRVLIETLPGGGEPQASIVPGR